MALPLQAQKKADEKVLLISAKSAQLIDQDGQSYRKVLGPAKFFHNNTYLLCDTALWNVNTNVIDAMGHVRIIQDRTQLSSATLQYVVDDNMARFRGDLVQLEDKDKNTLRTRFLDYNTKDSVAVFQNGAAMRDKDGQIIESLYGTYDSKAHLFVFNDQVNMYMDTTFVKTSRLEYRSDLSTAYFGFGTDMWQDDKMLSANDGWYKRGEELFFFRRNVHLLTRDQEAWADTLFYERAFNNVEMLGKVELMDTTRNAYALAGRMEYTDSLSQIRMTREPAVMSISEENNRRDTVYVGADLLLSRGIRRCDIPEAWVKDAEKRLSDISGDPVMEYRRKAAEAAAKAAEEAVQNDPNFQGQRPQQPKNEPKAQSLQPKPETPAPTDTLGTPAPADTLGTPADSLGIPRDTSKVNFLWGSRRVRLFRRDLQLAGDSLSYSDLDSLVRVYQDPVFYNEGNRQYASDSIYMVIKNKQLQRAHLLSNAFITIQEDPHSYDQIRGTEMVAYFDSTTALTRFDALGGASSLFFLEEQGALATVNKVDAKMIYATFANGEIERMYYYDTPKNDGYPTVQLPSEEKQLKGFRWNPERRPASPRDVTSLEPRPSQRLSYLARPHAKFVQTNTYFPGYIKKVYRDIAIRDSLQVVRQRQEQARKDSLARVQADSLVTPVDSLVTPDPIGRLPEEMADDLGHDAPSDTLVTPSDTLVTPDPIGRLPDDPKALAAARKEAEKARKKAERQVAKEAKQAEREAKWAEDDLKYEQRQAAKAQRKLDRERARKLKALKKLERKAQKERLKYEKYLRREQEKALKQKTKKK